MEKFPDLKINQVALLRAERNTGHVLDDKLDLAISDSQTVYTIFESAEEALKFADLELSKKENIEIVIYSSSGLVLQYLK